MLNSTQRVAAKPPTRVCPIVNRINAGSEAASMSPSTKRVSPFFWFDRFLATLILDTLTIP